MSSQNICEDYEKISAKVLTISTLGAKVITVVSTRTHRVLKHKGGSDESF